MRKDTKARDFDRKTKIAISQRDSIDSWPCCVFCGAAAPSELAWSNAHYISRAQGGLAVPENGLTLCPRCHKDYDQTIARNAMKTFFRVYLMAHYPGWDEEKLKYNKMEERIC